MMLVKDLSLFTLSFDDLEVIEATMLPIREKHYLRLLAHCLASFHAMADGSKSGPLPDPQIRLNWLQRQPVLLKDQSFITVFLEQLEVAGRDLKAIASDLNISPLELRLEDLIQASKT